MPLSISKGSPNVVAAVVIPDETQEVAAGSSTMRLRVSTKHQSIGNPSLAR